MLTRENQALHLTSQPTKCPSFVNVVLCAMLCAVFQTGLGSTDSSSKAGNTPELRSGAEIIEQLPVKAEREFRLVLNRDEVAEFAVTKGDLNVSVGLYDPGGQQICEYVSHSYEPVALSAIADLSGVYVIKIRSLETASRQDEFVLTVQPVRRATNNDRNNAAARIAIANGTRFSEDWTEISLRHAVDEYAKAAGLTLDPRIACWALRKAGEVYFVLGHYKQALDSYQRAAKLSARARDKQTAIEALAETARLHALLGNSDKAQEVLDEVLAFYSRRSLQNETPATKHAFAQALNHQAEVFYSKENPLRSLEYFKRALELFKATRDRNGEARALLFLGHIENILGRSDQVSINFGQAQQLYHEVGNLSGEALTITAQGLIQSFGKESENGIHRHEEALTIFRRIGDHQSEAITLNAIGQAYDILNENQLALNHYQQALKLFQESGTTDFVPGSLYQVGVLYQKLNDTDTALKYFQDSDRLSRTIGKPRFEAYSRNGIASIYASQGKPEKALKLYPDVIRFYASIKDPRGQALAYNDVGDLLLASQGKRKAFAAYKQALSLSEQCSDAVVQLDSLYNVAHAAFEIGSINEAKSYIERSIEKIETLRTHIASPDYRSSFFSPFRKHYDLYVRILMQLGLVNEALLTSERARARAFVEMLGEAGADIRQGIDPALLKREAELQRALGTLGQYEIEAAGSAKSSNEQGELKTRLDELRAEYEEIQAQVRNQSPRYQALSRPKPLTIADIQAQLKDDDLLLEYVLGDKKSYLWAVTPTSVKGYELESRSVLEAAALEFYKLTTARQQTGATVDEAYQSRVAAADGRYGENALALSRMLLGPVADILEKKRLIVVTEGMLQYISFDALLRPDADPANLQDSFLINDHVIAILPSVSALAVIRAEVDHPVDSEKIAAVFADPVFSASDDRVVRNDKAVAMSGSSGSDTVLRGLSERGGLRRLAYASDEADSISAAASGNAWVLKGFGASRDNAMSEAIGQYAIVHFATHGLVNTERPELSGIVLSMLKPDGTSADGFLQLHDVFNLKLSAELTVLSACDTALGKDVRGEGLIGLTRGLMYAGSRSVVASLWKVDDRATAVLMSHFYKALLQDGLPRAAALRYAKQQLRKDPAWASPYFWAGFVLQGEYDKPIAIEHKSHLSTRVAVLLVLVCGGLLILSIYRAKRTSSDNQR